MMRVVVDASAIAAVIFEEEGAEEVVRRLEGAVVYAPALMRFELANTAVKKARKFPAHSTKFLARLSDGLVRLSKVRFCEVHAVDVALIAQATGLSAYDASYMWLAGWLEADLITLDKKLAAATGFEAESIAT